MDYKELILSDLEKGYSKADLERLIGLPKNNLAGVLKGNKKFSRKSELKIDIWEKSEKPSPLQAFVMNEISNNYVSKANGLKVKKVNPLNPAIAAEVYNATHTDSQMQVKEVHKSELEPHGKEQYNSSIEAQIKALEEELSHILGTGQLAKDRKKFLQSKINNLKSKL